jgi:hypothetical protein
LNREQLRTLLLEASQRTSHKEFVIVGSLAILGAVVNPPPQMVVSIDVDVYLKNDPQRTGELVEALGQGSTFEDDHGYYLDPVSPNLPSFPQSWESRLLELDFGDIKAFFVDPNDVGVSKYVRGDDRDMRWLRAGLNAGLLNFDLMLQRMGSARVLNEAELTAARKRLERHRKHAQR